MQKTTLRAAALLAALSLHAGAATLFADSFTLPDGLITNDFASYHPSEPGVKVSASWYANSGSLFANNGHAWTGRPDNVVSDAGSTNGTGSAIFRLYTKRADFRDVAVSMKVRNEGLVSLQHTPAQNYDGIHIWVRYLDETRLYAVTINRRDNLAVIKKKVPGGYSNGGSYHNVSAEVPFTVPYGLWRTYEVRALNNADGSVKLELRADGALIASGVDRGLGGVAAYASAGRVGVRGDNCQFRFDDFTVSSVAGPAAPVISAVQAVNVLATAATIKWTTNLVSHSQVEYGATTAYGAMTPVSVATGLSHQVALSGLKAGVTYHYRVKSRDDATGLTAVSGDYSFTTPGAAIGATNVAAGNITSAGAFISWRTDVITHSQVEYGQYSSYGSMTARSSASGLYHGVALSALKPGTLYHYRVRSAAPDGREGVSGDYTFVTAPAPATAITESNVAALNITASGALISWKTNLVTHSQVDYGPTSAYGKTTARSSASGLYHGMTLTGLAPSTVYHYRVRSALPDGGREGVSGDFVFKTAASATSAAR